MVLFLLAVVWAVVLLGPKLQNRNSRGYSNRSRSSYGSGFSGGAALGGLTRRLATLDRSSQRGAARVVPIRPPASITAGRDAAETFADVRRPVAASDPRPSVESARARRKQVLIVLSVFSLATFGIAISAAGLWIAVHLFADFLFLGYIVALVQRNAHEKEREQKVRPLRPDHQQPVEGQAPERRLESVGS